MAKRLSREKECYLAARRELNPRLTQVESSHEPLSRDMEEEEEAVEEQRIQEIKMTKDLDQS